jgi:hypothetical protein
MSRTHNPWRSLVACTCNTSSTVRMCPHTVLYPPTYRHCQCLLQLLVDQKLNAFSMKSGLTLGDFGWGSKTFAKMGREKIRLIRVFLQLGVQVVISDVDVMWLRNPLPFFDRFPAADILTSSDHLANTVPDESLEIHTKAGSAANIGACAVRVGKERGALLSTCGLGWEGACVRACTSTRVSGLCMNGPNLNSCMSDTAQLSRCTPLCLELHECMLSMFASTLTEYTRATYLALTYQQCRHYAVPRKVHGPGQRVDRDH